MLQTIISKDYRDQVRKDLRELLVKVCEHANDRCAKVITARSKVRIYIVPTVSSHSSCLPTPRVQVDIKSLCDSV